jgi:phospholipid/cholesterol/gamma-HCH transport system substrate-binding protein
VLPVRRLTNEFLVGLLAVIAVGLAVAGVLLTNDRPEGVAGVYHLVAVFDSAEGVYATTPIRIAGVPVGAVSKVVLDGSNARVELEIEGNVQLPTDSVVGLASEGMLGDKFLRISPGKAAKLLADGDAIGLDTEGSGLDALEKKAGLIADDIKAITGNVRTMTGDPAAQEQLKLTLQNVAALSESLRGMADTNRDELAAIATNMREVSEALRALLVANGPRVTEEMATLQKATASLDRTASHVESIVAKIDGGEGTVGGLINDGTTLKTVNDTLAEVQDTVTDVHGLLGQVSNLKTEVYYRGDFYFGSAPTSGAFEGNPVAGSSRNVLGARIMPREDYGYIFEFVSHPIGSISFEDHSIPSLGVSYREYVVLPDYRYTFQIAKRFHDVIFRFGLKESSGGVGVDGMLFHDKVMLSADVYDFTYGSWPVMNGIPNVQLTARAYPLSYLYVEGGLDNVALGARYGFVTGFVGGGFRFNDDDLKFVLAALPFSP